MHDQRAVAGLWAFLELSAWFASVRNDEFLRRGCDPDGFSSMLPARRGWLDLAALRQPNFVAMRHPGRPIPRVSLMSRLPPAPAFPVYTTLERRADLVIHVLGLCGAVVLAPVLLRRLGLHATPRQIASVAIYLAGLVGMLSASAAYNLTRAGPAKARLRVLDRSMIYVMIAGTYTPFALDALPPSTGNLLFALVWSIAGCGVAVELSPLSRLHYNLSLLLYLALGWIVLAFAHAVIIALVPEAIVLLVCGGVLYTIGAVLHARGRMPFHNPVWHALVAAAATLHFAAIADLFRGTA